MLLCVVLLLQPREEFYLRHILRVVKNIEIYEYSCVSREFTSDAVAGVE